VVKQVKTEGQAEMSFALPPQQRLTPLGVGHPVAAVPQRRVFTAAQYMLGGRGSRIMMSLASGLPNEIAWALENLVKHSFTWDGNDFSPPSLLVHLF